MKRLLSILLCLCISLSFMPVIGVSAEDDYMDTLKMFGFDLDASSYDTNALKPGSHPIAPKYDLYIDYGSKHRKSNAIKGEVNPLNMNIVKYFATSLGMKDAFTNAESKPYFVSTGFAATSTGVDDHIAKVYFEYGASCANIFMSIYDAQGNALVKGYNTGGYVVTSDTVEMWEFEGLLSVTAGDFDGDGIDEIAVYTPNNADEDTSNGKFVHISLGIFEFDKKTNTVTTKQYLDVSDGEICMWSYSYASNGKQQFYSLPYMALCGEDLNGDGIADLSAIMNFSTWFRIFNGSNTYTTAEIINPNKAFASVLEVYEGQRGGNLKQSIKHKTLVTEGLTGGSSNASTKNRFILRNANITVGDVTGEGSREIIIAGNYTRATVQPQTNSTTKVTSNRFVEVDGEHALCHIVGYTTYENLKNCNPYDSNTDYHWTVQRTGNGWTYWYNEDSTDSGPITTSLCAYKHRGTGYPDTIFVGGQLFEYNPSSGNLEFKHNYEGRSVIGDNADLYSGKTTSVVWIGKSVAANITGYMFGREVLFFPFYFKVSGKDKFNCKVLSNYETIVNMPSTTGESMAFSTYDSVYVFEDATTQKVVSLALLDGGNKTSYITYDGNNTDVYYSDVEVLSIMQAPPLYEELGVLDGGDHIGNSSTSFAKSEGSAEGTSHGGALTAGVIAGFEQETSFLGLFKVGGAEYEFSITGTVSYDHETETSVSYTSGFATSGVQDTAVVFAVPYVRYNCTMYVPEYTLPTESEDNTLCAFRDELLKNLENYIDSGETQSTGTYARGCKYYMYKYSSYVTEDNYQDQAAVLYKVAEEIDFIEKAIASFNKGGTGTWGGTVESATLPYHYNIPQQPMVTTVSVDTYDAIAEISPNLDKIYGNVFHEGYRAGDPSTYAHIIATLNAVDEILQSKQAMGDSQDGFLTNSSASAAGSSQSQSISVEKSTSDTVGWGAAVENTSIANVGGAKVGFTVSAEYNGSSVKTTTEGNEYSGEVVALPANTPADYTYGWKLVAYNAKLNGSKVPVVGYLTKMTQTPPPSIAQNISVEEVTDKSATITWEDGDRPASYYKLSRVYVVNGEEQKNVIANHITSENGTYSYTINNLTSENTSTYVLESYSSDSKGSVPTDKIIITTFPKNFSADITIEGIDENVIYRSGKTLNALSFVTGNKGYDTLYQWQINDGDGWEDITDSTSGSIGYEVSVMDNESSIRCKAIIMVGDTACVVYSDPLTINCARSYNGYNVDWNDESGTVTVTCDKGKDASRAYIKIQNASGVTYKTGTVTEQGVTFDISDSKGDVEVFIWDESLSPVTPQFEG